MMVGCTEENELLIQTDSSIAPNSGVISARNFSLTATNWAPTVVNLSTGEASSQDVTITANIGDRNNLWLTDTHVIFFRTEWGLLNSKCSTTDGTGTCEVTWSSRENPQLTGDVTDGEVTVVAYTLGEERFEDLNGNGTFDDGETFTDQPEPYIDVNSSGTYDTDDIIIDRPNALDPTGNNEMHDPGDGLFNGAGCTHSVLCSPRTTSWIFTYGDLSIFSEGFMVSGTISGIPASEVVRLALNGGAEIIDVSADGNFAFTSKLSDSTNYTVGVFAQPASASCSVTTNGTGIIVGADITTVTVVCT